MSALGYGVALDAKEDRIDVRVTRAEAERDAEILTGDALPAVLHTTVVALVPADEYDAMVAELERLRAPAEAEPRTIRPRRPAPQFRDSGEWGVRHSLDGYVLATATKADAELARDIAPSVFHVVHLVRDEWIKP
jgi:flavin reductase (DIM6/NTAB) family NADH-FMN oxidoreductase RutF